MLLTLDIGNSAAKGGLFEDGRLVRVFQIDVALGDATPTVAAARWREALASHVNAVPLTRIGITTVVPGLLPAVRHALDRLADAPVAVLHPDMALPFAMEYETPDTLGMDRLAAAASAWTCWGQPSERSVVAVDVGTAVNYEVVDRAGVYRGGAIAPGPLLAEHALRNGTAQLPNVPLQFPSSPVGTSTQTALQSGILWGAVDAVGGMIQRLAASLPDAPFVVLTGGWGETFAPHLEAVDTVAPHLVLDGVRVLLDANPPDGNLPDGACLEDP